MHLHEQLTTVFTTEEGAVCRCTCCELFQVSLGNALLSIHPNSIEDLLAFIDGLMASADVRTAARAYTLRPDDRPYAFIFNYRELQELKQLLEGAQAMYALKNIVASTTGLPNSIY